MNAAAFFDLDRTVMSGASTWYFGVAALRRGFYSRRSLAVDAWSALMFARRGSTDDSAEAVRQRILGAVQGKRRDEMDRLVPDVLGPILGRVHPEVYLQILDLGRVHPEVYLQILDHERSGVPTYLCSASPVEILLPIVRALNMTGGVLGTVAAVDDRGVYTGELAAPFCYGQGKRIAMEREAERRGLELSVSFAYSDSLSDLPMLEAVGRPVVVSPDAELDVLARERGWPELRVTSSRATWRTRLALACIGGGAAFAAGRTTGRRH